MKTNQNKDTAMRVLQMCRRASMCTEQYIRRHQGYYN